MLRGRIFKYIIVQYYFYTTLMVVGEDQSDLPKVNITSILRYGHHRVQECEDPKKTYICIMKCLELGYQIAKSDKKCKCTCLKDPIKAKYYPNITEGWQVPTTSLPPWAVVSTAPSNYVKLIGNYEQGQEEQETTLSSDESVEETANTEDTISTDIQDISEKSSDVTMTDGDTTVTDIVDYTTLEDNDTEDVTNPSTSIEDATTADIAIEDTSVPDVKHDETTTQE